MKFISLGTKRYKHDRTEVLVYRKHPSPPGTIFFPNALPTHEFRASERPGDRQAAKQESTALRHLRYALPHKPLNQAA
jgi:hypothetical protein